MQKIFVGLLQRQRGPELGDLYMQNILHAKVKSSKYYSIQYTLALFYFTWVKAWAPSCSRWLVTTRVNASLRVVLHRRFFCSDQWPTHPFLGLLTFLLPRLFRHTYIIHAFTAAALDLPNSCHFVPLFPKESVDKYPRPEWAGGRKTLLDHDFSSGFGEDRCS